MNNIYILPFGVHRTKYNCPPRKFIAANKMVCSVASLLTWGLLSCVAARQTIPGQGLYVVPESRHQYMGYAWPSTRGRDWSQDSIYYPPRHQGNTGLNYIFQRPTNQPVQGYISYYPQNTHGQIPMGPTSNEPNKALERGSTITYHEQYYEQKPVKTPGRRYNTPIARNRIANPPWPPHRGPHPIHNHKPNNLLSRRNPVLNPTDSIKKPIPHFGSGDNLMGEGNSLLPWGKPIQSPIVPIPIFGGIDNGQGQVNSLLPWRKPVQKPTVLTPRFSGGNSDSISAWGMSTRSQPSNTGHSYRPSGSNKFDDSATAGKRFTRNIRNPLGYDVPVGVVDYVPVGSHTHHKPKETSLPGDRYDVWTTNDAELNINVPQSDKLPPGYYNYKNTSDDELDNHRAPGFRPSELFPPDDRNISINLLDKHPEEYYEYSVSSRSKRDSGEEISSQYFDGIVDIILAGVKRNIRTAGKDGIKIPDISKNFSRLWMKGNFKAWDGWFLGADSLQRSDSMKVHKREDTFYLTCKLMFDTLKFGYSYYQAQLLGMGPTGTVNGSVEDSKIVIKADITVLHDNSCQVAMERVRVTNMDDPQIQITGLGPFNWLASKITTWMTEHLLGRIMAVVSRQVQLAMENELQKHLCDRTVVEILKSADTQPESSG